MSEHSIASSNTGFFSNENPLSNNLHERSSLEDLHQYVRRSGWPLGDYFPEPLLLVDASDKPNITKSTYVYISERLRLSLDRHFEAISIHGKLRQAWFKHAILSFLEYEQNLQKDITSASFLLHQEWPLKRIFSEPSLIEASDKINYRKHIALYLSEKIRLSLEKHLQNQSLSKREWLEKAILHFLRLEQEYFFIKTKKLNNDLGT